MKTTPCEDFDSVEGSSSLTGEKLSMSIAKTSKSIKDNDAADSDLTNLKKSESLMRQRTLKTEISTRQHAQGNVNVLADPSLCTASMACSFTYPIVVKPTSQRVLRGSMCAPNKIFESILCEKTSLGDSCDKNNSSLSDRNTVMTAQISGYLYKKRSSVWQATKSPRLVSTTNFGSWQRRYFELPSAPCRYLRYFRDRSTFERGINAPQPSCAIALNQVDAVELSESDSHTIHLLLADGGTYMIRATEGRQSDASRWYVALRARVSWLKEEGKARAKSNTRKQIKRFPRSSSSSKVIDRAVVKDGEAHADKAFIVAAEHMKMSTKMNEDDEKERIKTRIIDPYVDSMTDEEQKTLLMLKNRFQDCDEQEEDVGILNVHDLGRLLKYVRARGGNQVDSSESMLRRSIAWRKRYRIKNIFDTSEFLMHPILKYYGPGGSAPWAIDRDGAPVRYERIGRIDPNILKRVGDMQPFLLYEAYKAETMEKSLRGVNERSSQKVKTIHRGVTVVQDLRGLGFGHMNRDLLQLCKYVAFVLDQYYPENLKRAIVINAPFVFAAIWNVLKHFVAPATRDKIEIVGSNPFQTIEKYIDPANIPAFIEGGQRRGEDGDPNCSAYIVPGGKIPDKLPAHVAEELEVWEKCGGGTMTKATFEDDWIKWVSQGD